MLEGGTEGLRMEECNYKGTHTHRVVQSEGKIKKRSVPITFWLQLAPIIPPNVPGDIRSLMWFKVTYCCIFFLKDVLLRTT